MSAKSLRIAGLGLIAALSGNLAACKEAEISEVPVDVGRVDLSAGSFSVDVGSSVALTATPKSQSGKSLTARPVQFSSSNPSVAQVAGNGQSAQVTGISAGTAVVTATSGSASATANVTVILPNIVINIDNHLISPVTITVNSSVLGTVPARTVSATVPVRQTFQIPGTSQFTLDWDLVRPTIQNTNTPLGEQMGGRFDVTVTTQTTFDVTVDNEIAGTVYFAPVITNNTAARLLMAVNFDLSGENRCNCVVPANATSIYFGYYTLYSNSNVRGYVDGSNYTGGWVFWTAAQINAGMMPLSGVTPLVTNVAPGPGSSGVQGETGALSGSALAAPVRAPVLNSRGR